MFLQSNLKCPNDLENAPMVSKMPNKASKRQTQSAHLPKISVFYARKMPCFQNALMPRAFWAGTYFCRSLDISMQQEFNDHLAGLSRQQKSILRVLTITSATSETSRVQ